MDADFAFLARIHLRRITNGTVTRSLRARASSRFRFRPARPSRSPEIGEPEESGNHSNNRPSGTLPKRRMARRAAYFLFLDHFLNYRARRLGSRELVRWFIESEFHGSIRVKRPIPRALLGTRRNWNIWTLFHLRWDAWDVTSVMRCSLKYFNFSSINILASRVALRSLN